MSSPNEPTTEATESLHLQITHYFQSCCVRHAVNTTPFDSVCSRSVSVMLQVVREYNLLPDSLVCATILYIQRYLRHRHTVLTNHNIGPLFAVALNTVSKYYDDLTYNNLTYAQLAGIPIGVFNLLEIDFIGSIRFNLALNPERVRSILVAFRESPEQVNPVALVSVNLNQSQSQSHQSVATSSSLAPSHSGTSRVSQMHRLRDVAESAESGSFEQTRQRQSSRGAVSSDVSRRQQQREREQHQHEHHHS